MPIGMDSVPSSPFLLSPLAECSNCGHGLNSIYARVETYAGISCCTDCTLQCQRIGCANMTRKINAYIVDEAEWCKPCTSGYSVECGACNNRMTTIQELGEVSRKIMNVGWRCHSCITNFYRVCLADVIYVANNDICGICGLDADGNKQKCSCNKGTVNRPIHDYSCKRNLVFHGKSKEKIHMGFELESQINGGSSAIDIMDAAIFAMNALQTVEIAEMKSDSSIGGGFEMVTQPHTYEKYRDDSALLWETIDTLRTKYRARAWDNGRCGLHIHISRNAFRDGLHTHRFIEFIYRNPEMLMKFAGRNSSQYATFSDCWGQDEYGQPTFDIREKLKTHGNTTRGSAVNTQNKTTIELRFFRGTMRPSGVIAALGLIHAICQYTRHMVPDVQAPREQVFGWEPFRAWVEERADEYKELVARFPYIKEINLNKIPNIDA